MQKLKNLAPPGVVRQPSPRKGRGGGKDRSTGTGGPPSPGEIFVLLRRLLAQTMRAYWKSYVFAGACMATVAGMTTASAWIMRDIVDQIFVDGNKSMLWFISAAVLAIFVVKGLAAYAGSLTMSRIGNAIVADNRRRLFNHILLMSLDFHVRTGSARIVTNVTRITSAAKAVTEMVVSSLLRDLLTVIGLAGVMIYQKPVLSLFAFATGPVALLGTARLSVGVRKFAQDELKAEAGVIRVVQETMRGIRDVKSFRFENVMRERAREATEWSRFRSDFIARVVASTTPLMETLGGIAIAGVILYGGWQAIEAGEPPGAFFAFITALLLAYEPAKRLARLRVSLAARMVAIRRMFNLLDMQPTVRDLPGARQLHPRDGAIRFEKISFAYRDNDAPVFDGLDLSFPGKRITAIIGPSGGGKSSLVNLLLRLYEPSAGRIMIDGQDIAACTIASLRDSIACVGQEVFLFDDSVYENIRVGWQDADREDIEQTAKLAGAHEFISELPDGYETVIGENGVRLSGGQRQRLAIARAFIRPAPILVLDEATSALDPHSEKAVLDALRARRDETTVLLITHRLGIVRHADRICVIDAGKLVEAGTHEELLATGGFYARLHALHEMGVDAVLENTDQIDGRA